MIIYQKYNCIFCDSTSSHPYNVVAILVWRYVVKNIVIFNFVHITQPYAQTRQVQPTLT